GLVALGGRQQLERPFDGELVGGELGGHRGRLVALAQVRPVPAVADDDLLAVDVLGQGDGVDHGRIGVGHGVLDERHQAGGAVDGRVAVAPVAVAPVAVATVGAAVAVPAGGGRPAGPGRRAVVLGGRGPEP